MGIRDRQKPQEADDEDWMLTYADVVTLLLCFFVLIISITKPGNSELEHLKNMFSNFSVEEKKDSFSELEAQFSQMIEENTMEQEMSVEQTENGLMLELSSGAFYESGSAQFKKSAIPILEEISAIMLDFDAEDYQIRIEGHSDDVPIKTAKFPSNWELSAMRATVIVRFFIEGGQEREKMSAISFADVKPKVPNIDEFGEPIPENRALNRRIVINIERVM